MPGQGQATVTGVRQGSNTPITVSSPYTSPAGGSNFLPIAMMGIQALGSLSTSFMTSKASSAAGEYEASVYESNARLQDLMAKDAIQRGKQEAIKAKQATKRLIASQRVTEAAQGIDIESGSALDIQEETASLGAEEAMNITNNAWRESWGYKVRASDYRGRAEMAKITAKNKARSTILTGGMSALKDITYGAYLMNKGSSYSSLADFLSGVA